MLRSDDFIQPSDGLEDRLLPVVLFLDQDGEPVAAEPAVEHMLAGVLADDRRDLLKDPVALCPAVTVVDELEAADISAECVELAIRIGLDPLFDELVETVRVV